MIRGNETKEKKEKSMTSQSMYNRSMILQMYEPRQKSI